MPQVPGGLGYLESLDKLEALEVEIILPAHGPIIKAPINAIQMIRERLLERGTILVDILKEGPKEFWDLNETFF
jgi:glyoxylase-like metal-dependent hydrolase (beta-lactamase superfamily II)